MCTPTQLWRCSMNESIIFIYKWVRSEYRLIYSKKQVVYFTHENIISNVNVMSIMSMPNAGSDWDVYLSVVLPRSVSRIKCQLTIWLTVRLLYDRSEVQLPGTETYNYLIQAYIVSGLAIFMVYFHLNSLHVVFSFSISIDDCLAKTAIFDFIEKYLSANAFIIIMPIQIIVCQWNHFSLGVCFF